MKKQRTTQNEEPRRPEVDTTLVIQCEGHVFAHLMPKESMTEHARHGFPDLIGVECSECHQRHDLIGDQIRTLVERGHKEHFDRMKQFPDALQVEMKTEHRRATASKINQNPSERATKKQRQRDPEVEPEDGAVLQAVHGQATVVHKKGGGGGQGGGGGGQGGGGNPHG